ncbi:MAG: carboxylating nicotinate-nucleotide diphosphorylase [Pseudomonadota bacterium]
MSSQSAPAASRFVAHIDPAALAADRKRAVAAALAEDVGSGDVTASLVGDHEVAKARVIVRESAVLCGSAWFDAVMCAVDATIRIEWLAKDGDVVEQDQKLCSINGPARAILTAERAALNFLQTLSGTATTTHRYAQEVAGTGCRLLDTRKTIPGLRLAQKYATAIGGAKNHRIGLYDALLIKENHIASTGSIAAAIARARTDHAALPIEIEVESIDEMRTALDCGVERILLDNFSTDALREAVAINRAHAQPAELEASGGIEQTGLRNIAETGVDFISIGALTKHLQATDFSMRFVFS